MELVSIHQILDIIPDRAQSPTNSYGNGAQKALCTDPPGRQIYEENFGFNMFSTRPKFLANSRDHLHSVCRLLTPFVGSCVSAFVVGEVSCTDMRK